MIRKLSARPIALCVFFCIAGCGDPSIPIEACQDTVASLATVRVDSRAEGEAFDIQLTEDGGYVVVGRSANVPFDGDNYEVVTGSYDGYVVKLDANGGVEWRMALGSENPDEARSVCSSGDGGYIVVGNTGALINTATQVYEPSNILIAKIDGAGNEAWSRVWDVGGNTYNAAYSVCVNLDGSFVVAGSTSAVDIGPDFAFLAKFDDRGDLVWQRLFKKGWYASAQAVIATRDNGYAFIGFFRNEMGLGVYVVKTDGDGVQQWEYVSEETRDRVLFEEGESMVETGDGGYAMVGSGNQTPVAMKLDGDGKLLWTQAAPGAPRGRGRDLVEAADGSLVLAGESFSRSQTGGPVCTHMYAARFSANGEVLWDGRLGDSSVDYANAIVEDGAGNFILAGTGRESSELFQIYLLTTSAGGK